MVKKLIVNIADEMETQLTQIQREQGFFTKAETVRACLNEGMRKLNPAYIQVRKTQRTPEERAIANEEAREAREKMKFDSLVAEKSNICDILEGQIEDIAGFPHCKYRVYTEMAGKTVDSVPVTEPLENLNQNSIDLQYRDIFGNTGPEVKKKLCSY